MTKPRDVAATANDNSIPGSRIQTGTLSVTSQDVTFEPTGSTNQRSSQSKLRDVISIKDFGAVGDGATDDTAAIQAALTWASTTWDTSGYDSADLYVPPGIYKITSTLNYFSDRNPLRLYSDPGSPGLQTNCARFSFVGTFTTGLLIEGGKTATGGSMGCRIANIGFRRDGGVVTNGIELKNISNPVIDSCRFQSFGVGVLCSDVNGLNESNVRGFKLLYSLFTDCTDAGVKLGPNGTGAHQWNDYLVFGSKFFNCGRAFWMADNCYSVGLRIQNCVSERASSSDIVLHASTNVLIEGNYFEAVTAKNLYIDLGYSNTKNNNAITIQNNNFQGASSNGYIGGAFVSDIRVKNNSLSGATASFPCNWFVINTTSNSGPYSRLDIDRASNHKDFPNPGLNNTVHTTTTAAIRTVSTNYNNIPSFLVSASGQQRSVDSKLRDFVSVLDFIPESEHAAIRARNSSTDLSAYIQAAFDYAESISSDIHFPAGLYPVSSTLSFNGGIHGEGRSNSVLKHNGASYVGLLNMTSSRNCAIHNMGFEGSGATATEYLVRYTNGTTRNILINNCSFGRYAVAGHGGNIGLWLDGDNYLYRVSHCLFDYNGHSVKVESTNGLGWAFDNCRFEHCLNYCDVLMSNGSARFEFCAFQFGQGAPIMTEADSVDYNTKVISGNTATGSVEVVECTFEKNNRGQWDYVLDGSPVQIGYVSILNGRATIEGAFFTASAGENASAVLVDTGSASLRGLSCSSSQIDTFLRGGANLSPSVVLEATALGAAVTSQHILANQDTWISEGFAWSAYNPSQDPSYGMTVESGFFSSTNAAPTGGAGLTLSLTNGYLYHAGNFTSLGENYDLTVVSRKREGGNWRNAKMRFDTRTGVNLQPTLYLSNRVDGTAPDPYTGYSSDTAYIGGEGIYSSAYSGTGTISAEFDANGRLQRSTSDSRLKTAVEDISIGLDAVLKLRPVEYDPISEDEKREDGLKELGLIAQEVNEIIPNVVSVGSPTVDDSGKVTEAGYYGLNYQRLVPVLIKAVQELSAEVQALKASLS